MIKLLLSLQILLIGFFVGLILGTSTPDSVKSHFAYTIKKEMQIGKELFWIGDDLQFKKTKFRNPIIYTVEVKKKC